jgi:hypothetical protein
VADERDPERLGEDLWTAMDKCVWEEVESNLDALVSLAKRAPQVEPPGDNELAKGLEKAWYDSRGVSSLSAVRWLRSQPWWPGRRG